MKINMLDIISDENNLQIIKRLIRDAVDETITGDVRRPQAQYIIDWRQNFVLESVPPMAPMIISHHFPVDPKAGEIWTIPTKQYGSGNEKITVAIDRVVYEWNPLEYENGVLYGWFLEINIECHLLTEDES